MKNFKIRTEDFKNAELKDIYVETTQDRSTINTLKSENQLLLVGSRGVGKTMLMKIAKNEMNTEYYDKKRLPVYMSFSKGILVNTDLNKNNFRYWMLAKILNEFRSSMLKIGIITEDNNPFGDLFRSDNSEYNGLDKLIEVLEESWREETTLDSEKVIEILDIDKRNFKIIDDVDFVKTVIERFCELNSIEKVILMFDEACHNFIPRQQREFFTLFRDLRSPFICCKAAVYPGITYYGTVQTFHDVIIEKLERNILDPNYIENMREMVKCQLDEEQYKKFEKKGMEFNSLILCAGGNPRLLLKSLEIASYNKGLSKSKVNETIKEFYRVNIWDEHSKLANMYSGHKKLIDWGRNFIEDSVLKSTHSKNSSRADSEKGEFSQTIFFAIHRDSPESIKRAIRILEYSGIISIHTEGTKVRGNIYDRYQLNLGIVIANEASSKEVDRCFELYDNLSIKLYSDYSKNSPSYAEILNNPAIGQFDEDMHSVLKMMLNKSIDVLDITLYQRSELKKVGFNTLKDILKTNEYGLQKGFNIGPVRSRNIYNLAYNAAIEYISG